MEREYLQDKVGVFWEEESFPIYVANKGQDEKNLVASLNRYRHKDEQPRYVAKPITQGEFENWQRVVNGSASFLDMLGEHCF